MARSPGRSIYAFEADAVIAGVAAWTAPDDTAADLTSRLFARVAELEVRTLFPRAGSQLLGGFEELGRRHPPFPHWYLAFIGIDPRGQRHGFGRLLREPVLARADSAGVACYLETSFPDTRPFYERLAFQETDRLHPVMGCRRFGR